MPDLDWIDCISNRQIDPKNVISERLPTTDNAWLPVATLLKKYTLVFVVDRQNERILLGYKKRGMGKDLWNGFGGKPEWSETMEDCAKRELEEEAGLMEASLTYKGQFVITDSDILKREGSRTSPLISLYICDEWKGDPVETEEMKPKWFQLPSLTRRQTSDALDTIPTNSIWPEQRFFLTELLCLPPNETLYGRVEYETLAVDPYADSAKIEEELVTKDGKHRLKSWRFVRVRTDTGPC